MLKQYLSFIALALTLDVTAQQGLKDAYQHLFPIGVAVGPRNRLLESSAVEVKG